MGHPGTTQPARHPVRVFVNYRRDDAAGYAGRLYDSIASRFGAENVFMDVDTIDLGSDFHEAIEEAISSCDVVIALIGRQWLSMTDADGKRRLDDPGDVLRLELEHALAHGLVLIPARVQDADLPSPDDLPTSLAPLARRQAIELRDTAWRDDVERLLRRLDQLAQENVRESGTIELAPTEADGAHRNWPNGKSRRKVWTLSVLALLLVAVAAVLAITLRDGGGRAETGAPASTSSTNDARLLAAIPTALAHDCRNIDWGPEAALVSVECGLAGTAAAYSLFENESVMSDWYELTREEAKIAPGTGACGGGKFRGENAYVVDKKPIGRYFCFVDDGEPTLVWTDTRATVGVKANVWDSSGPEAAKVLMRQWSCCLQLEP